jgi:HSP20 family protein
MSQGTITRQASENATAPEGTRSGRFYRPDVDIIERPDELLVVADMPGLNVEDIDIRFEDGSLIIHGRVSGDRTVHERTLLQEYGVGDYYRTFRISEQVDSTRISAEYHDGVLSLHLPKSEAAKPRKIQVQTS